MSYNNTDCAFIDNKIYKVFHIYKYIYIIYYLIFMDKL